MKTLHLYLTRQVLATLMLTVAVFTFVLLLGNALKEILVLLVNHQASLGMVLQGFGLLIPWVLAFALPMGMLTAALLVFGRFSADQELTAVRSSGISLVALISPILLLSILLCGVCTVMNLEVAPRCRVAYKDLLYRMGIRALGAALPEGTFVKEFPPYIFYVEHNDGHNHLSGVWIWQLDENQKCVETIFAPRATLITTNDEANIHMEGGVHMDYLNEEGMNPVFSESMEMTNIISLQQSGAKTTPSLSNMTFTQLQAEMRGLEQMFTLPSSGKLTQDARRRELQVLQQEKRNMTTRILVQMHRQVAFSFACFGFTLIGIPLGIRAHRRETNVGIAMALVLVLVYYSFVILGQSLENHPEFAPHLIIWIPNLIFQAAGAVMLWRANRGV